MTTKTVSRSVMLQEHPEGIALMEKGDVLLTPKRHELVVPNTMLAEALMVEFSAPAHARPLLKLAYTAIDLCALDVERDGIIEALIAYLHTDSICYFAEEPELAKRERKHWQPILDWAETQFSCEILTFEGVMPADQPAATADIIREYMFALDSWKTACLLEFTRGFGSLVLALAVLENRIDADTAFTCSQVDEDAQREQWGVEDEAAERREKLKHEMLIAEVFLGML